MVDWWYELQQYMPLSSLSDVPKSTKRDKVINALSFPVEGRDNECPSGEQPCQPPGLNGQPLTLPGGQQSLVFWLPQRKCCRVEDGYVEERGLISLRNAADQLLGTGPRCG